jgi:acyl-CoA synthetase (AMP-forming)/AMP-acid ligase II
MIARPQTPIPDLPEGYPGRLKISQMLREQAARTPNGVAIAAPGCVPVTFSRLWSHVTGVAGALRAAGVGRNDRVALVLPNGPEMATALLGVSGAATSAPLNPAYRQQEFEFYLADLQAKALIVPHDSDSPATAAARGLGVQVLELCPDAGTAAGLFYLRGIGRRRAIPADLAEPEDVALVLHTSGTTSRPKIVSLTHANLCASAVHIRAAYGLTHADRALNVMPLFHMQGLMVTLSSLLSGGSVVSTPGFDADRFFGWLEEFGATWYSAAPTIHQAVLEQAARSLKPPALPSLRFVRSSAAPLPPSVMAALEQLFRVPVIEGYGMTESAMHVTSNPLPPGRRKPGSVGVASGAEVGVMDEAGHRMPVGACGEVVFRGPSVMAGYENNEAANREAFRDGWLRTGDEGYLDEEGYLYLTGRLKEIINRGGEKISPREVDEVLLEHPAVAQAVTFALPHPVLGEDVGAAVVLREWGAVNGADLRRFAAARLAHFKVPREILVLEELPKGPTGKLQRIGLAERLGLTAPLGPSTIGGTYSPPGTPLEHGLCEIWQQVLGIPQIGVHDNFLALGGHSLLATQAISRIRQTLHVEVALSLFLQIPTVAELAEAIVLLQTGESRPLRNA